MRTLPYSVFRNDLKSQMRRCRDDAEAILVSNKDESENVVVMSARDYDSLMETIRVYENPYLFDKVTRGMHDVLMGETSEHELIDA